MHLDIYVDDATVALNSIEASLDDHEETITDRDQNLLDELFKLTKRIEQKYSTNPRREKR